MSEPNWVITIILGAIVGFLLPYILNLVRFIRRFFKKEIAEGNWYVYHMINRDGIIQVENSMWKIKKGFYSKFIVEERKVDYVLYKGLLVFERNFWLVRLKGIKHDEEVYIRLINPIPTQDTRTQGLFLSLDYNGIATAGPVLISRKEILQDKVKKIFFNKIKIDNEARLISV